MDVLANLVQDAAMTLCTGNPTREIEREVSSLTTKDRQWIQSIREEMWRHAADVPVDGESVHHLDQEYRVPRGVFAPQDDSKALIRSMRISKGDHVLDIGCGSGVLTVHAILRGAAQVLAVDVDVKAVEATLENAGRLVPAGSVEAVCSDLFASIPRARTFDAILANLPFTVDISAEIYQRTMLSEKREIWTDLFAGIAAHLRPGGRAWIAQANFGSVLELLKAAAAHRFHCQLVGRHSMQSDPRIFYAFEFWLGRTEPADA